MNVEMCMHVHVCVRMCGYVYYVCVHMCMCVCLSVFACALVCTCTRSQQCLRFNFRADMQI